MLISHESPICLFNESRSYNDYDYALVHLFERNSEYYKFFEDSLAMGREVLLDNSIFELKTAFDADKFASWIRALKPTLYIVPDALEDSEKTIQNFKDWQAKYSDLPGLKIGAVQGKTYEEIVNCYRFMADNADYIAISFDFSYYQTTALGRTKLEKFANGRRQLIQRLIDEGIWNHNKPHHLLGATLPTEFNYYTFKGINSIRSLDTSNPVIHGMLGNRYVKGIGLPFKSSMLLADNIDTTLTPEQVNAVLYNVEEFKQIVYNGNYY
ncbi:MAG: hypothetical protein EBU90_27250 [Proteobacteria bacterium]|nr:hypothetical protein [Pseudomonadota bacterium]NBP16152.1 hypothetical protein [bacterium]